MSATTAASSARSRGLRVDNRYQRRWLAYCLVKNISPDEWINGAEYIAWINRKSAEYKQLHGLGSISDHDDFTEFLEDSDYSS